MKQSIITFVATCLTLTCLADNTETPVIAADKGSAPVETTFNCNTLIDHQTCMTLDKNSRELLIQHRSGRIKTVKDIFGLYGASNISMGFNYGITDKLTVGVATERDAKYQTLNWKYAFLEQTENDSIPFSLTYYGNISIDAGNKEAMGEHYKFGNTLSNFHELILARKINDKFSVQASSGYCYYTFYDSTKSADQVNVTVGGYYNFYKSLSLNFTYAQPFTPKELVRYYHVQSKPNAALGIEVNTMRHDFQLFATTYRGLLAQQNYMFNANDFTKKDNIFIGFNLTVRFF